MKLEWQPVKKLTALETEIIAFIKTALTGKRYLCEFVTVMPLGTTFNCFRYQHSIRAGKLTKMVKKRLIIEGWESGKKRTSQTIYYLLPKTPKE